MDTKKATVLAGIISAALVVGGMLAHVDLKGLVCGGSQPSQPAPSAQAK